MVFVTSRLSRRFPRDFTRLLSLTPVPRPAKRTVSMSASDVSKPEATGLAKSSNWNSCAAQYKKYSGTTLKYGIDSLEFVGVKAGDKLLDVATGPGDLAIYAASEKGAIVDGIDFASESIAILKGRLEEHPLSVTPHVMDGMQLEFSDDNFDIVSSCFGVFLFPDHMKGVKEMFRVTKPGGKAVVVAWAEEERAPMRPWLKVLQKMHPELLPLPLPSGVKDLSTVDGMKTCLAAAGFGDIEVTEVTHAFEMPDPNAYAQAILNNPALSEVREALSPEQREELIQAVVDLMSSEFTVDGAVSMDAVAIIGRGVKTST